MKKRNQIFVFLLALSCLVIPAHAEEGIPNIVRQGDNSQEEVDITDTTDNLQAITYRGDVENGITNSITFEVYPIGDGVEYDEPQDVILFRTNKYIDHGFLEAGYTYRISDIKVDDKTIKTEDIEFTLPKKKTAVAFPVDIKILDGCSGEIVTDPSIDRGLEIKPTKTKTPKITKAPQKQKTETTEKKFQIPKIVKQILLYGSVIGVLVLLYFGYRKLKEMWQE